MVGGWSDFEVGDRDYETFIRLYRRLPEAERYRSGPYQIYEWLPSDHHMIGKGSEVNWKEGLHSVLRSQVETGWCAGPGATPRAWICCLDRYGWSV